MTTSMKDNFQVKAEEIKSWEPNEHKINGDKFVLFATRLIKDGSFTKCLVPLIPSLQFFLNCLTYSFPINSFFRIFPLGFIHLISNSPLILLYVLQQNSVIVVCNLGDSNEY